MSNPAVGATTLMTVDEVSQLYRVHPDTVRRWGRRGKLTQLKTPGGGRTLFRSSEVYAAVNLAGSTKPPPPQQAGPPVTPPPTAPTDPPMSKKRIK